MNEPGNVFDVSTTLMEIDDLPEGGDEGDARPEVNAPPALKESEPHYFSPGGVAKQADFRRRALAAIGLAAGGVMVIALGSAAVGFGHGPKKTAAPVATPSAQPTIERYGDAPEPAPRPQTRPKPKPHRSAATRRGGRPSAHKSSHSRPRHRHHAAPSPAPAPEPETTYTPEPEPTYVPEAESTYVPVEETAPPPPPAPSGGGQEFGIEP